MKTLFTGLCAAAIAIVCLTPQTSAFEKNGSLLKCANNLRSFEKGRKNVSICEALELYAIDHKGKYPKRLADLMPKYLRAIPTCPTATKDTYSAGYHSNGRQYTISCSGTHHSTTSRDYPNATSLRSGDPVRLGPGQPPRYIWTRDRGLVPNSPSQ